MKMNWRLTRHIGIVVGYVVLSFFAPRADAEVKFSRDIAPILTRKCISCHGERSNLGGYRAQTFRGLTRAGVSGKMPIVPGSIEKSNLYRLLTDKSPATRMPKGDQPLPPASIRLVAAWIRDGAKFDEADPDRPVSELMGPRIHPASPLRYPVPVAVTAVSFSPNGSEFATGGYNEILVWSTISGKLIRRLAKQVKQVRTLIYVDHGRKLIVAGGSPGEYGELSLVDSATGTRERVYDTLPDIVLSAAVDESHRMLVCGSADYTVRGYSLGTGTRSWLNRVHSDWVTSVSISSDGQWIAAAGKDMTVKVFEGTTGALFTTYSGHNKNFGRYKGQFAVYAVAFGPEGHVAYSAGAGPTIHAWEPERAAKESGTAADMEERFAKESHAKHIVHGFRQEVFAMRVLGGTLFAVSADGGVKQFDPTNLSMTREYVGHRDWVFALDYHPASHRLVTGSFDGEIRLWDTQTGLGLITILNRPR